MKSVKNAEESMSIEVRVPTLGESIVDAVIARWLKHEGATVTQGEALVELETDKVNVEVTADQGGVLQEIARQEGETVAIGDLLGVIGTGRPQGIAPTLDDSENGQGTPTEQSGELQPGKAGQVVSERQKTPSGQLASDGRVAQRPPSPLARRIAAEYNIDLSQVKGSSPHGRVTKDDVVGFMAQQTGEGSVYRGSGERMSSGADRAMREGKERSEASQADIAMREGYQAGQPQGTGRPQGITPTMDDQIAPRAATPDRMAVSSGREERVRLSRRRQTIAQRLVEAQHTAAMLTTFNEIDMSAVMEVRSRRKDAFKERHNISLGFMSFFTKAVVGSLKAFPRLNAEIQGNEMVLKHYYDIGIAVGAEEGLVVPVLRDADRKSFAEIEQEIATLAKKARENSLALTDLQGGTFTVTNGGVFGSLLSTPILNAPQVGILGMHKIEQRPVVVNGQIVIRPMMYVALSYDHRIVDGREAVQFLVRVKELVEDPETLLLEG